MYLCIDHGYMYITDAPEPMLKAQMRINPSFHYEPIEYAHTESIKAHLTVDRDGVYHDAIKDMAKQYRAKRAAHTGKAAVMRLLKSLSPEQLKELLEDM